MKSIIIIQLCWLLLTIVSNGVEGDTIYQILRILQNVSNNDRINGVLQPLKDGFLGSQSSAIYWKGFLHPMGMPVAIKITTNRTISENERTMLRNLDAMANPHVWFHGVPFIYYNDTWRGCFILAMTSFDREYQSCLCAKAFTELDFLILFREFVRIAKYMHSRLVFYRRFEFTDMMFSKQRGFICDFCVARELSIDARPEFKLAYFRGDWKKFFEAAYIYIRDYHWEWLGFIPANSDHVQRMENPITLAESLKGDSESAERHQFAPLRKVFVEFAKYAYSNASAPEPQFYDRTYEIIVEEIEEYAVKYLMPAIPSWLCDRDRHDATSAANPIPSISSIADPFEPDESTSSGESE